MENLTVVRKPIGSNKIIFTDLGGTSVWYHILKGKKMFFLIPPTDANLKLYEKWVLSGKQSHTFFGNEVESCERVVLEAGNTFFIPSGWIHAVYTPEDTIVFGGNFLHSFGMEKQLQVAHIEEVTRVPQKFRFPFFTEMLWYLLDRYIHCLYGRTHLDLPEDEKRRLKLEKGENIDPNREFLKMAGLSVDDQAKSQTNICRSSTNISTTELNGIKYVVMYLHHLPSSKKNVPLMLPDPIAVIKDIRQLVLDHKDDNQDFAITGKYVLRWTENDDVDNMKHRRKSIPKMNQGGTIDNGKKKTTNNATKNTMPMNIATSNTVPTSVASPNKSKPAMPMMTGDKSPNKKGAGGNRRRRVRCKTCDACLGGDCKLCVYCKDMTKYGGPGRMKQTCEKVAKHQKYYKYKNHINMSEFIFFQRRCLHPQLPVCAYCSYCKLDGWFNEPKVQGKETERPEQPPNLFECTVCLDIVHPGCAEKAIGKGRKNDGMFIVHLFLPFVDTQLYNLFVIKNCPIRFISKNIFKIHYLKLYKKIVRPFWNLDHL